MKAGSLLLSTFFVLLVHLSSDAQVPWVKWSIQEKESEAPIAAFNLDGGKVLCVYKLEQGEKIKNATLKIFDSKLNLKEEIEYKSWINPKWNPKDYDFESIQRFQDSIFLFFSSTEKDQVKLHKCALTSDYRLSDRFSEVMSFGMYKPTSSTNLIWLLIGTVILHPNLGINTHQANNAIKHVVSTDRSKHLFYNYSENPEDKTQSIEAYCYDDQFRLLYRSSQPLQKSKGRNILSDKVILLNNGDFLFNYIRFTKKSIFGVKTQFTLAKVFKNGAQIDFHEFTSDREAIDLSRFYDLSADQTALYAFETKLNKKGWRVLGFELRRFNIPSMTLDPVAETPIDKDLINKVYTDKKARKIEPSDGLDSRWKVIKLSILADGGFIAILEDQLMRSTTYTSNNGKSSRTYYDYLYGDLMVLKFQQNQKLEWSKVLYRRQGYYSEASLPYMGTQCHKYGNQVYLIYNDNGKNISSQGISGSEKKNKSSSTNLKKTDAVMKIITSEGNVNSKTILNGRMNDVIFRPTYSRKLDDTRILLDADIHRKKKIGILYFDSSADLKSIYLPVASISPNKSEPRAVDNEGKDLSPEEVDMRRRIDSNRMRHGLEPLYNSKINLLDSSAPAEKSVNSLDDPIAKFLAGQDSVLRRLDSNLVSRGLKPVYGNQFENIQARSQNPEVIDRKWIQEANQTSHAQENQQTPLAPIPHNQDEYYSIQILASKPRPKKTPTTHLQLKVTESYEDGYYKYLVGKFKEQGEAQVILEELRRKNILGFIVQYRGGNRVQ